MPSRFRPPTSVGVAIIFLALCAAAAFPPASPIPGTGPDAAIAKSGCGRVGGKPATLSIDYMRSGVHCLVNAARARHGLHRLRNNPKLRQAAMRHSVNMVSRGFFSHVNPSGSSPGARIARTGYFAGEGSWGWGENIAWGEKRLGSPKFVVRAWMNSPIHRGLILSPGFREIGIGVSHGQPSSGGRNSATYTLDFGYNNR